jgi:hypothetical protein
MSLDLDLCCFSRLFANPTAMELSTWTGVGGCSCPISFNVFHSATVVLVLLNMAPHSASAAEDSVLPMMVAVFRITPFPTSG